MKIIKAIDIDKNDDLFEYSNPKKAQKNAYKIFGKNGILYKSTRKDKKYMILNPYINKFIHFGNIHYQDYLKHNDENRRYKYLKRAMCIKGNWFKNAYSPNSLSINILWD